MELPEKVKRIIVREGLIERGDRVLHAISGGIDSVALFHILKEIREDIHFELGLAHINHGLRGGESERDEKFVIGISKKFGFPVFVEKVNVKEYSRTYGLSLQHAARDLRYNSLFSIAEKNNYNKIAVAHTLDDQVETFFLRVLKGTGINGISSIPIRRGPIIRPFLFTERGEIERYCIRNSIEYVEDSSNRKTIYQRNYLRQVIMPLFYKINPRFKEKIVNLLSDFAVMNEILDEKAKKFIENRVEIEKDGYLLRVEDLRQLDQETRFRVISEIVKRINNRFIAQRNHVRLIERILLSTKPSLSVKLPGCVTALKSYDKFFFTGVNEEKRVYPVVGLKEGLNDLPAFGLKIEVKMLRMGPDFDPRTKDRMVANLDGEKVGKLTVRTFREGDRFIPLGLKNLVKLKDFFIKNRVPKDKRRRIPIVLSDENIVWVLGMRIDERYKVKEDTKLILRLEASYQNNKDKLCL